MRTKELFDIAERKKFEEIDFLLKTDMLKPVFPS